MADTRRGRGIGEDGGGGEGEGAGVGRTAARHSGLVWSCFVHRTFHVSGVVFPVICSTKSQLRHEETSYLCQNSFEHFPSLCSRTNKKTNCSQNEKVWELSLIH